MHFFLSNSIRSVCARHRYCLFYEYFIIINWRFRIEREYKRRSRKFRIKHFEKVHINKHLFDLEICFLHIYFMKNLIAIDIRLIYEFKSQMETELKVLRSRDDDIHVWRYKRLTSFYIFHLRASRSLRGVSIKSSGPVGGGRSLGGSWLRRFLFRCISAS